MNGLKGEEKRCDRCSLQYKWLWWNDELEWSEVTQSGTGEVSKGLPTAALTYTAGPIYHGLAPIHGSHAHHCTTRSCFVYYVRTIALISCICSNKKAGGGDGVCADRLRSSLCHASTKMLSEAAKAMTMMSYRKPAELIACMLEDARSPGRQVIYHDVVAGISSR